MPTYSASSASASSGLVVHTLSAHLLSCSTHHLNAAMSACVRNSTAIPPSGPRRSGTPAARHAATSAAIPLYPSSSELNTVVRTGAPRGRAATSCGCSAGEA